MVEKKTLPPLSYRRIDADALNPLQVKPNLFILFASQVHRNEDCEPWQYHYGLEITLNGRHGILKPLTEIGQAIFSRDYYQIQNGVTFQPVVFNYEPVDPFEWPEQWPEMGFPIAELYVMGMEELSATDNTDDRLCNPCSYQGITSGISYSNRHKN